MAVERGGGDLGLVWVTVGTVAAGAIIVFLLSQIFA
jgi:hypothetical protein